MIKTETVLVLGAGASMPYGYPSGHTLRQMLIDPGLFNPLLEKQWFEQEDINAFCRIFMHSGMKSIDAFLADQAVLIGRTTGTSIFGHNSDRYQ